MKNLVKGGCGRSAEDVLFSALIVAGCMAAGLILCLVALMLG